MIVLAQSVNNPQRIHSKRIYVNSDISGRLMREFLNLAQQLGGKEFIKSAQAFCTYFVTHL
jgi:hypothetical protein